MDATGKLKEAIQEQKKAKDERVNKLKESIQQSKQSRYTHTVQQSPS